MKIEELKVRFTEQFGDGEDPQVYFAPGRVNLIGEHTDYNGGHVFPCALTLGVYALARRRSDNILNLYSENVRDRGVFTYPVDAIEPSKETEWTDYPKGVIWTLQKYGCPINQGMDVLFWGNIPDGAGLSSSAAIEVLTGVLCNDLFCLNLSMTKIALYAQYSENQFIGMNCGIMDPFTSAMGKKDHALFLDTNTLDCEYVPINLGNTAIIITNSKIRHSLVSSAYNERRKECERGLALLQKVIDINSLGELNNEQFERYKILIPDETIQKRVRHAVSENRRTVHALDALQQDDICEFGRLMNKSHLSLRDDFEVSCDEIDLLVKTAWELPGVLGSRMTGGGFGGCTVSLVRKRNRNLFRNKLTAAYREAFDATPDFYEVEIGDGAGKIEG